VTGKEAKIGKRAQSAHEAVINDINVGVVVRGRQEAATVTDAQVDAVAQQQQ